MSLYLLQRKDRTGWDEYDACVVRAKSRDQALRVAANLPGASGPYGTWTVDGNITVTKLESRGPAKLILGSFNAG